MRPIDDSTLKLAAEIAKAAVSSQTGVQINNPDGVAKFLETVATKLEDLRIGPEKR